MSLPAGSITDWSAEALSGAIRARRVSCREVMQATLGRIHALNPRAKAFVNLAPDDTLLAQADALDAEIAPRRSAPGARGWLHGVPQAIKDTGNALGFPTTFGSPLWARAMPTQDSLYVARMKAAGCIVVGKTNMPEFGLGSHTYNPLFGSTPNAWDGAVSAGGSSGGAAVALALRMLPVADGSDFMGSLRNPAGWNHVFGLRPSQGRVPAWPKPELFVSQLGTDGPMARTVRDLAALLSTQAGHDARVPLSLADAPQSFVPAGPVRARGLRIGWLGDLGGHLAVEPGILDLCQQALKRLEGDGAIVEPAALGFDLHSLWNAWLVWRRALVAPAVAAALKAAGGEAARAQVKPEALWEHDSAQGLGFTEFMQAAQVRSAFQNHMVGLMARYDALALPVAQVWPFRLEETWPRQVAGRAMDTYHRWMECTLYATFAGLPAASVPAGFHAQGRWPMGLQLIGQPLGDAALLRLCAAYEQCSAALLAQRPPDA
ncbi:amidase, Asp-tRNAAsn/Glu-tRNAGln amidotransferase A subunit [Burkholderiales bacterium JOSHI_001]|nr:amidase, Asp-tRNAAsn/Glu-tRNAGln amidotransferase A subunit [Burkholderiales bacterium JOSHI_001]